jgi:hypothetical protein
MGRRLPSSFQDHFAPLTAPRCPHAPNSRHLLMDILVIAVCAVISGAEEWEDNEISSQQAARYQKVSSSCKSLICRPQAEAKQASGNLTLRD